MFMTRSDERSFLEEYHIEGVLGGGRYSTVLHARGLQSGKQLAVKLVRKPSSRATTTPAVNTVENREESGAILAMHTTLWDAPPVLTGNYRDPNDDACGGGTPSVTLPATRLKRIRTEYHVLLEQLRERHQFLVEVDRIGHTTNYLFFVMRRYEHSLAQLLRDPNSVRNTTLSEEQARFVCLEILVALEFLHFRGVVYRDLKPENVLLGDASHIVLSDFDLCHAPAAHDDLQGEDSLVQIDTQQQCAGDGLVDAATTIRRSPAPARSSRLSSCSSGSQSVASATSAARAGTDAQTTKLQGKQSPRKAQKGPSKASVPNSPLHASSAPHVHQRNTSFVGTLEYLSPDVVRDEPVTPAIDLWCLGVLLYEMLFGFTLFRGNDERDVRFKQEEYFSAGTDAKLTFPLSPQVSDGAKDLLQKLLCPVSKHRATAATVREHSWIKKSVHGATAASIREIHRSPSPLVTLLHRQGASFENNAVHRSYERYLRKPPRTRPVSEAVPPETRPSPSKTETRDRELGVVKTMLAAEVIQRDNAADGGLSFFVPVAAKSPADCLSWTSETVEARFRTVVVSPGVQLAAQGKTFSDDERFSDGATVHGAQKSSNSNRSLLARMFSPAK